MKRIIFITLFLIWSCNIYKNEDSIYKIRIKNNTNYYIENIELFKTKFNNLKKNSSSPFISIPYKTVNDNAIFSLDANETTFIMYIDGELTLQQYTYRIDSLNFKNRFIYFKKINN